MFYALFFGLALQSVYIAPTAEQRMLADLNTARARAGLPALVQDERLSVLAREHGLDMAEHHYFDHLSSDGRSPFDRMRADAISFSWAGENIALSSNERRAFRALVQSPEHLANMMQAHFSRVGIGVVRTADGEMFFVQDFTD